MKLLIASSYRYVLILFSGCFCYCLIKLFSVCTKSLFTQNVANIHENVFSILKPDIMST